MARYNDAGQEIPDDTPVEWPLGVRRPETIQEQIKRLVRTQLSDQAAAEGKETFEEANDFQVDEEPDLVTPHEYEVMMVEAGVLSIDPDQDVVDNSVGKTVDEKKGSSPAPLASARSPISKKDGDEAEASAKDSPIVKA